MRRVLVALDLRDDVLGEAAELGCHAILTHHHPPIFPSLAAVTDDTTVGDLVLRAAEARIAIIAAHTNLDAAAGGLNDVMAQLLGLTVTRPLRESVVDSSVGLGRIGQAPARYDARPVRETRGGGVRRAPPVRRGSERPGPHGGVLHRLRGVAAPRSRGGGGCVRHE